MTLVESMHRVTRVRIAVDNAQICSEPLMMVQHVPNKPPGLGERDMVRAKSMHKNQFVENRLTVDLGRYVFCYIFGIALSWWARYRLE